MAIVKSKPCRCVVLPGGHHLHADSDTAAPVQEAIATFLQAVVSSESSSPESQSSVVVKRLVIAVCVAATVGVARFIK
jgi:Na+-transporting NADH:ubiquinone oxidoreductase subunit NqrB